MRRAAQIDMSCCRQQEVPLIRSQQSDLDAVLAAILEAENMFDTITEKMRAEGERAATTSATAAAVKDQHIFQTRLSANRRGRLRIERQDQYLQSDIPCGISDCCLCHSDNDNSLSPSQPLWIIDLPVLLHGSDFLWDDPAINNGIVLESFASFLQAIDTRAFLKTLRLCRVDSSLRQRERRFNRNQKNLDTYTAVGEDRHFLLFSNDVFAETFVSRCEGQSEEAFLASKLMSTASWYRRHLNNQGGGDDSSMMTDGERVFILTSNKDRRNYLRSLTEDKSLSNIVVTLKQFIKNSSQFDTGAKLGEVAFKGLVPYPDSSDKLKTDSISDKIQQTEDMIISSRPTQSGIYPSYATAKAIALAFQEGKVYRGNIRMQPHSCFKATVMGRRDRANKMATEIQIIGALNINRAINGDQVIVEILDSTMIDNLASVAKNLKEIDGTEDYHLTMTENEIEELLHHRQDSPSGAGDAGGAGAGDGLSDIDHLLQSGLYGRVIGIVRRHGGSFCGTIRPRNKILTDSTSDREIVPVSGSIPTTVLASKHLKDLELKRLVFVIDDWRRDDLLPQGHWTDNLGPVDDIETECKVILREHGIATKPFSKSALACLPDPRSTVEDDPMLKKRIDLRLKHCLCDECRVNKDSENPPMTINNPQVAELLGTPCLYTIEPDREVPLSKWSSNKTHKGIVKNYLNNPKWEECEIDENLSGVWTCSIDPPTCVDIDDALSVKFLSNGNCEIGVHIADVTHYVKSESALDREAADRCTTVYLVNQRTDMLPKILSADLCSLRAGRDRLCFSVFWEMNHKGKIIKTKFWKSIIHSSAAFSYEQAQKIIDNDNDTSPIAVRLRVLMQIAKALRSARFKRGSVELASTESKFTFTKTKNANGEIVNEIDPVAVTAYEHYDTHWLIEEFMLQANISVAQQILQSFPRCSVLRRHPQPKGDALENLAKAIAVKHNNVKFKFASSKELAKSLDKCTIDDDPLFNKLVRQMAVQCMNRAVYFCTGEISDAESRRHYALAADLYTHFTSPIRRYADIMVHRLLSAAINWESLSISASNLPIVVAQCEKMTDKHACAQFCQRASADYFAYRIFNKIAANKNDLSVENPQLTLHCIVTQVRRNGLILTCPAVSLDSVCNLTDQESFEFVENCWVDKKSNERISLFDHVIVRAYPSAEDFRYKVLYKLIRKATAREVRAYNKAEIGAVHTKNPDSLL